jgi:alpha-beta hydrolase superfamily lysophospholipase
MRQYRLLQPGMARLFVLALLLLTACGSGSIQQRAAPIPTPQMPLTPTIPPVPSRLVHFTTQDHVRLAGLLYGHGGTTAIVCSHMWPDSKADWFAAAPWFAARGFLVLAYDFRGLGDSEGQADVFKLDKDLTAAITFVKTMGATKIVLLGASGGGAITLKVAARMQVAAVITLSADYFAAAPTRQDVMSILAPKLFVSSQHDAYINNTMQVFEEAKQPKALHLYPGMAHGTYLFSTTFGQDLIERIIAFAQKYAPLQ